MGREEGVVPPACGGRVSGDDASLWEIIPLLAVQAIGKLCQIISGGFLVCQWHVVCVWTPGT